MGRAALTSQFPVFVVSLELFELDKGKRNGRLLGHIWTGPRVAGGVELGFGFQISERTPVSSKNPKHILLQEILVINP